MVETVQQALARAVRRLQAAGCPGAARDARRLMAAALDVAPDRLTLHMPDALSPEGRFAAMVNARAAGQPVAQIIGGRWFYGRWFKVTEDVLDPRPESETLIAAALEGAFSRVLDLGTGSGCLLLTLLAARQEAQGLGVDISPAALAVCAENRAALGLEARAALLQSDWFAQVTGRFDLIVANPPYIAADEMAALGPELAFEPRIALTDEADGLNAYRHIAAQAGTFLSPDGRVLLEIGWQQGQAVGDLLAAQGFAVRILPDLDGRDRVVSAREPG